ncbi:MAG: hypothetical protein JJLCMIEE_00911 [Acidimicrobiales bacterium]|nr:hypothetical protein [Acidimicrobiales bacterium]
MQLTPPTEWTNLATYQDIERLDMSIENVRVRLYSRMDGLDSRIDDVRVGLEARMDGLEADLRAGEARLSGELHRLLRLQTIWLIGAIFTLAALVLTAANEPRGD